MAIEKDKRAWYNREKKSVIFMIERVGAIAREAGQLLRDMAAGHRLSVYEKGSRYDFVSEADFAAQKLIKDRVAECYPRDRVIGEEDGLKDRQIMALVGSAQGRLWLVDPLDGTVNYIRGLGGYAVSVAVFESGEVVCGAIYLPESDELYLAERGAGATLNGQAIHVSTRCELSECVAATHVPVSDMSLRDRALQWNARVIPNSQNLRILGSCIRTQAKVAQGGIDFYYEYGPHPWDVAAGSLIVQEAGGVVTRLDGGGFDFGRGGILSASAAIYDKALRLLSEADDRLSEFQTYPG